MTIKLLLLGDHGVGKTSYLHALHNFHPRLRYDSDLHTSYTEIYVFRTYFHIYELSKDLRYSMTHHNIYRYMDAFLILFDITVSPTRKHALSVMQELKRIYPRKLIQLVATKCDISHSPVSCSTDFIMTSAYAHTQLETPFRSLLYASHTDACYTRKPRKRRYTWFLHCTSI